MSIFYFINSIIILTLGIGTQACSMEGHPDQRDSQETNIYKHSVNEVSNLVNRRKEKITFHHNLENVFKQWTDQKPSMIFYNLSFQTPNPKHKSFFVKRAAKHGCRHAMGTLSQVFSQPEVGKLYKACKWSQRAKFQEVQDLCGCGNDLLNRARNSYEREGESQESERLFFYGVEFLDQAFQEGSEEALHILANLFWKGLIHPSTQREASFFQRKPHIAFKLWTEGATRGNTDSFYKLGKCYEEGRGCNRSPYHAFSFYETAAQRGHEKAQNEINSILEWIEEEEEFLFNQKKPRPSENIGANLYVRSEHIKEEYAKRSGEEINFVGS